MFTQKTLARCAFSFVLVTISAICAFPQTTAFTYQGKLTDASMPANGQYDLIFRLFDLSGTRIGSDLTKDNVQVTAGIFTLTLDFGASPFTTGTGDSLEIAVRPGSSTGAFTTLTPRQPLTSSPYALKSISSSSADTAADSSNLGGIGAGQYVVTTDPRMTNSRPPTAGSTNYIQNSVALQSSSNFNVSGNGVVGSRFSVGGGLQSGDTTSITSSVSNPFGLRAYSSSNGSAITGLITGGNTTFPAVLGQYSGTGTGAGVFGANSTANGTGIVAIGNGQSSLVLVAGSGLAADGFDTGVFANVSSSGPAQSLYTSTFGSVVRVNYWNGTTQFKINGAGAVSTIVRDAEQKQRIMFAPEAPEVFFEDYGAGNLIDGKASIVLDPTFAANISVNDRHPLKVFIQLEGDCSGVYVTNKTGSGFEVIELQGGKSNVRFTWHVIGNRADEQLESVGPDGNTTRRISHYTDLRFPVQQENLKTSQPPATSPK